MTNWYNFCLKCWHEIQQIDQPRLNVWANGAKKFSQVPSMTCFSTWERLFSAFPTFTQTIRLRWFIRMWIQLLRVVLEQKTLSFRIIMRRWSTLNFLDSSKMSELLKALETWSQKSFLLKVPKNYAERKIHKNVLNRHKEPNWRNLLWSWSNGLDNYCRRHFNLRQGWQLSKLLLNWLRNCHLRSDWDKFCLTWPKYLRSRHLNNQKLVYLL